MAWLPLTTLVRVITTAGVVQLLVRVVRGVAKIIMLVTVFKGLFSEAMELRRDSRLRASLYEEYSLDELRRLVDGEVYGAIRPIFAVLDSVPQMERTVIDGRKYSARLNEFESARAIRAALRDYTDAGSYYLHTAPQSLLIRKLGSAPTRESLRLAWNHNSPRARRAIRSFASAVITLEVGAVQKSYRPPSADLAYWYASAPRPPSVGPIIAPSPHFRDYPEGFEEQKVAALEWWRRGPKSPTETNRTFKAIWDQIHHLHEAVRVLEEYWPTVESRGQELAQIIENRLLRR